MGRFFRDHALATNKGAVVKIAMYGSMVLLGWANVAYASSLQECRALENARSSIEKKYECWKNLADPKDTETQAETGNQAQSAALPANEPEDGKPKIYRQAKLLSEWDHGVEKTMVAHKQSYLLVTHSSNPNSMPMSPNPSNQAPFSPLDNKDLKFQLSVKGNVYDWGNENSLWLAYTQQSFWQVFDGSHSRPFRENNYEPEMIWSHHYPNQDWKGALQYLRVLNAGLVHQSNGQSNPLSRSWNRIYIQPGFEKDFDGYKLIVQPKIWARFPENPAKDDNPDITHYLGNGELQVRYMGYANGKLDYQLSALARIRSLQLDVDTHFSGDFSLHIQYFTGYGESLIDYNQRHSTLGMGFSLPF